MKFGCMMVFFETVLRRNNTISPLAVLLSFPRFQEWNTLLADSAEACQYYFEFFHRVIVLRAMFQRDGFSANARDHRSRLQQLSATELSAISFALYGRGTGVGRG